jgi:hypothetical protein
VRAFFSSSQERFSCETTVISTAALSFIEVTLARKGDAVWGFDQHKKKAPPKRSQVWEETPKKGRGEPNPHPCYVMSGG